MLRTLLLLLAGVLLGANVVYFVMSRERRADVPPPVAVESDGPVAAETAPADVGDVERVPFEVDATPVAAADAPADVAVASAATGAKQLAAGPRGLLVPVRGVAADALVDTYADARSQGRRHDAIDIMASAGTPVLAVADGHVEKLFTSERGGLTIYQFEPTGRYAYYYAHLQSYAPGLHQDQALRRGQVIGYVGSTGNASADAPHLHFAIFRLGPEKQWWKGTAINPYPLLAGRSP